MVQTQKIPQKESSGPINKFSSYRIQNQHSEIKLHLYTLTVNKLKKKLRKQFHL